jgi:hypothetical protein
MRDGWDRPYEAYGAPPEAYGAPPDAGPPDGAAAAAAPPDRPPSKTPLTFAAYGANQSMPLTFVAYGGGPLPPPVVPGYAPASAYGAGGPPPPAPPAYGAGGPPPPAPPAYGAGGPPPPAPPAYGAGGPPPAPYAPTGAWPETAWHWGGFQPEPREAPAWAAYVTGVPVDMRADRLKRAFDPYGGVVRVEPLPIKYPKRGARSAIVVFNEQAALDRALRSAPVRVDGARLGVRKFGDPEEPKEGNAIGRQERHALVKAGLVVFAGGVPAPCSDAEIRAAFECYGPVSRAWSFPANGSGGDRARCAFVVYSDVAAAARAIASSQEGGRLRLRGRALAVERPAGAPAEPAPRRMTTEPGRHGLPFAALSLADVPLDQRPLGG